MGRDLNVHVLHHYVDNDGEWEELSTDIISGYRGCKCELLPSEPTLITKEYCWKLAKDIIELAEKGGDERDCMKALGIVSKMRERCGVLMSYS